MLSDEERQTLRAWLTDPAREPVRDLIRVWPPGCKVTSREDTPLMIPAPGVVGTVVSWFESGTIGVLARLAETQTSRITGYTAQAGEEMKGECDPASLVFLEEGKFTRRDIEEALYCD